MKNVWIIALVATMGSFTLAAQPEPRPINEKHSDMRDKIKKWSPEQHAELRAKKMALHLNLTDSQLEEIYLIELEMAQKRLDTLHRRRNISDLSPDELFEIKKMKLEKKSQLKEQFKAILTHEQYEKWERMHLRGASKTPHKAKHHRR
jgi:periplasmic protein CpxP/Spy